MAKAVNLIEHVRTQQPATWSLLKLAAIRGHVFIDDTSKRLTLSPNLQQEDPRLHFLMIPIIDDWKSGRLRAYRSADPDAR